MAWTKKSTYLNCLTHAGNSDNSCSAKCIQCIMVSIVLSWINLETLINNLMLSLSMFFLFLDEWTIRLSRESFHHHDDDRCCCYGCLNLIHHQHCDHQHTHTHTERATFFEKASNHLYNGPPTCMTYSASLSLRLTTSEWENQEPWNLNLKVDVQRSTRPMHEHWM